MNNEQLRVVGNSLYQTHIAKEMKRYLVFMGRCYLHKRQMEDLFAFLEATPLRQKLLMGNPSFVEQVTRSFFYKDSTWEERIALVKEHINFLERTSTTELLDRLYCEHENVTLWEDDFQEHPLRLVLRFHAGQRKEGCLSLVLTWQDEELYQIMFWLGKNLQGAGSALWVGALQGRPQGGDVVKALTKKFFGYRTKNLIFYGLRNIAAVWGCECIYAVTNQGYYAMNHMRVDRKLKTDFGEFWAECGGELSPDVRFYQIPIEEYRKDMSELKPSKRAQHRRRFEVLDAITERIQASMAPYLKK